MMPDSHIVEFHEMKPDGNYRVVVRCKDCGSVINSTKVLSGNDLKHGWIHIVTSSVFVGSCPKGCPPTFSDCNLHTKLDIEEAKEGES
jgi:hypothetical protein